MAIRIPSHALLVNKVLSGIRIKRYKKIEDLLSWFWGQHLTLYDIRQMKLNLVCVDMKKRKMSGAEFLASIRLDGIYGFAYPAQQEIHFWCRENISWKKLLGFFGHEVGHLKEDEIVRRAKRVSSEVDVEKFAEAIRKVTQTVYKITAKLFPEKKVEKNNTG